MNTMCSFIYAQEGKLQFIENKTQWNPTVKYKADIPGGHIYFADNFFRYVYFDKNKIDQIHEKKHKDLDAAYATTIDCYAYDVQFANAHSNPQIKSYEKLQTYNNYFIGNNPDKWSSNVGLFKNIVYENLYDGINLNAYSIGTSFKYDFVLTPGSDASSIAMSYHGLQPKLHQNGSLVFQTGFSKIVEQKPYAYQTINGQKMEIKCRFQKNRNNEITFDFPEGYNHQYTLTIDPILIFATYSSSTAMTFGFSATYDNNGSLYSGGECFAVGWPTMVGAFQMTYGGGVDAGINKYTPTGNGLIYSTYYGGSAQDLPNNMVVNNNFELAITGSTTSTNLATTTGCYDNTANGASDIYVAHFNATGSSLIGATYIGGSGADGANASSLSPNYGDWARGELLYDASGDILISSSTSSTNFPTTTGAYQTTLGGAQDGCVIKINPTCTNLLFSTFLGGNDDDACFAIAIKNNNDIAVCGGTQSTNFPITTGAALTTFQGATDGFVSILNTAGTTLLKSTYLGTSAFDHAYKIQIDINDSVYVCGQTDGAYTITPGLLNNVGANIFLQVMSPDLSTLVKSTVIGNSNSNLIPTAFLRDICGNIYFCGFGANAGLAVTANAYQSTSGGFWLTVMDGALTNLIYGSYMGVPGDHCDGGTSRFDPQGIVYHSVCTASSGAYQSPGCLSPTNLAGSWDIASFKFDFEAVGVQAALVINPKDSGCAPYNVTFTNNSSAALSYQWDFGDSGTSNSTSPSHTYITPGVYTVRLIANNPNSCNTSDTAYSTIHVFDVQPPVLSVQDTVICEPGIFQLTVNASPTIYSRSYSWAPASLVVGNANQQTIQVNLTAPTTFTITVTDSVDNLCKQTSTATLNVTQFDTSLFKVSPLDTTICIGESVVLTAVGGDFYTWTPNVAISSTTDPVVVVSPANNLTYNVFIRDINGCKANRQSTIKIFPQTIVDAGEDQVIRYGESTQLHASGASSYFWNNTSTLSSLLISNPMASPSATETYYVHGIDNNGCIDDDSVTIIVRNLIIPNAFSPNNDGLNDFFNVKPSGDHVDIHSFLIFDRWGETVYHTNKLDKGWNGTFEGTLSEIGTYFYLIEYTIGSKKYVEKGDFTLLR